MMLRLVVLSASACALAGCAYMDSAARVYEASGLYVWDSAYSAGIGTENGVCVQAATTMTAANIDANVKASNDIMRLVTPGITATNEGDLINLGAKQTETVALTNVSTSQTAFANIAFFYLCQISLNSSMEEESIVQMWEATVEALPSIGQSTVPMLSIRPDPIGAGNLGNGGAGNGGVGASPAGPAGNGGVGGVVAPLAGPAGNGGVGSVGGVPPIGTAGGGSGQ